jgi:hypothetical protein
MIRESLKDFFDAQDAGDWKGYDKSIGKKPEPVQQTRPTSVLKINR